MTKYIYIFKETRNIFKKDIQRSDQELPQSQTADKRMASRAALPSQTRWLQNHDMYFLRYGDQVSFSRSQMKL